MTECTNDTMRDRLPELANGMLPTDESAAVRAHLTTCGECAAEFAVLETSRLVFHASAPKLDLAAITRAVTAPKPVLRVERGGATAPAVAKKSAWRSRQFLAAAASLLIVASLSIPAINSLRDEPVAGVPDSVVAVVTDTPSTVGAPTGLAGTEGLGDLSSADLSTLLGELERLEANVTAEPAAMQTPIVDTPEGY
jgi:anti-sigma factor RsiW